VPPGPTFPHIPWAIFADPSVSIPLPKYAPDRNWHDALYDALASLALLDHLVNYFQLAEAPVEFLLKPDTSTWHRLRHS
jgi:DNA polymerase-3 subunit epsilon